MTDDATGDTTDGTHVNTPPRNVGTPSDPTAPHPHRTRHELITLAVIVLVVVGGYSGVRYWVGRGQGHEVTVDDAAMGFTPGAAGTADAVRPAQGVYRYRGTGTETLSAFGANQAQGPEIPGTVTWRPNGCWTIRIDFNSNHHETDTYCATVDGLTAGTRVTFSRWSIAVITQTTIETVVCDPVPIIVPTTLTGGATTTQACTSTNTQAAGTTDYTGTYTVIGKENVVVGKETVSTVHIRSSVALTGAKTGSTTTDLWFETSTGLPVRNTRRIEVHSPSPIGSVTYNERGTFRLVSLTPHT